MRLAEGQVWTLLADHSKRANEADERQRSGKISAGGASDVKNEKDKRESVGECL